MTLSKGERGDVLKSGETTDVIRKKGCTSQDGCTLRRYGKGKG